MRIAVLGNLKTNAPTWEGMSPDQWADLDSPRTVEAIVRALESGGHEAAFFEASIRPPFNLIERLLDYKPDLCFNIAESHWGDGREAHIPSVLEMLRIPYTGSKVLALALALDKPMTKRVLMYHGLPPEFRYSRTPPSRRRRSAERGRRAALPMFVKPSRGHEHGHQRGEHRAHGGRLRAQVGKQLRLYNGRSLCDTTRGPRGDGRHGGQLRPDHGAPRESGDSPVQRRRADVPRAVQVNLAAYDASGGLYQLHEDRPGRRLHFCPALLDDTLGDAVRWRRRSSA